MATAAEVSEIIKLYVGYYNRAPDPAGLNFWIAAFDNGFSLDAMSEDFSTQPETLQNYPFFLNPSPSDEDYGSFIDSVYGNLFNRPPDEAGRAFWVEKLGSGEFTVGRAISLIIEGATTSPDQDVVANKVAVGRDFYIETNALPPYVFDEDDIQTATAIQASVTEDPTTVTAAAAQTDAYVLALGATTINLSANTDQPGGGGDGVDTQGSGGNDVYNGTIQQNDTGTYNASDSIAAGGGEDILNIRLVAGGFNNLGTTQALVASDLEVVNITNQTTFSSFVQLDMDEVTGIQQLTTEGGSSSAQIRVFNVEEGAILRMVEEDGRFEVGFQGDPSASSDDAFNLYVEDSGSDSQNARFRLMNENRGTEQDYEIANIETGGTETSFVDVNGTVIETLNVTGSEHIELSDSSTNFDELEMVDASGMTGGGLTLLAEGVEDNFTYVGSDFDDRLLVSNDLINNGNSVSLNAGDGTDALAVNNFNNLSGSGINATSGFEILRSDGHTTTLEADDFDINTFEFADQSDTSRLDVRGVENDDLFIFESDFKRNGELIDFEADTAGTELTFELRASSEDGGQIELVGTGNNNDRYAIDLRESQISEVTIVSSGSNEDANLIRMIEGNNGNYFAIGNASGPSNFNITGAQALTIGAEEGVSLTANDDELGFQEGVNLDGSAATGDLRIAGSDTADAIATGSGDDIIYGLDGDDMLTGNDGADQFRFSDWSGTDQITDFISGEDKIGLERVDFRSTSESQDGTELNSDDYVENLSNVASLTSAEDDKLVELQLAASQTQIEDTTATASDTYLLVFNSTTQKGELWYDDDWSSSGSRDHVATFDDVTSLADLVGFSNTDFVEYTF